MAFKPSMPGAGNPFGTPMPGQNPFAPGGKFANKPKTKPKKKVSKPTRKGKGK
jgi:hypothetical protein